MWELQAHVVGSVGIWPGGVNAGMLSNSSWLLEPACLQHLYCGSRNGVLHCNCKQSQQGLAPEFSAFSLSQIGVNMKRKGNSGS